MNNINKVGIIAMPRISVGGGFARATRDLIAALISMDKEVYLLTPFKVDLNKIKELYGEIQIKKFFYPGKITSLLAREESLARKLMINEFKKMAKEVDFIIDLDGGVFHNYLPDKMKDRYVIWRLSCINPETYKMQDIKNVKVLSKILIKQLIKKLVSRRKDLPFNERIYSLDEWTKKEIEDFWKIKVHGILYPEIKVEEFKPDEKKKNQIVILGRIAPNKGIHDSIEIFANGVKNNPYNLVILGGTTPDSEEYIKNLIQIIKKHNIENKVKIIKDPSFEKIKDVLAESKIIVDSQKGVSLTMTAIEAMAAGCIVIAQKNAGTYEEVLANGKYGYGFDDIKDGSKQLENILYSIKHKSLNSKMARGRAEFFSSKNFRIRLRGILNETI